ncbi:MAG: hypothetical protein D6780_04820, partial [Candidatus Dadabacteria bacterium]
LYVFLVYFFAAQFAIFSPLALAFFVPKIYQMPIVYYLISGLVVFLECIFLYLSTLSIFVITPLCITALLWKVRNPEKLRRIFSPLVVNSKALSYCRWEFCNLPTKDKQAKAAKQKGYISQLLIPFVLSAIRKSVLKKRETVAVFFCKWYEFLTLQREMWRTQILRQVVIIGIFAFFTLTSKGLNFLVDMVFLFMALIFLFLPTAFQVIYRRIWTPFHRRSIFIGTFLFTLFISLLISGVIAATLPFLNIVAKEILGLRGNFYRSEITVFFLFFLFFSFSFLPFAFCVRNSVFNSVALRVMPFILLLLPSAGVPFSLVGFINREQFITVLVGYVISQWLIFIISLRRSLNFIATNTN